MSRQWELKNEPGEASVEALQSKVKVSELFAKIAIQRGLDSQDKLDQFLHPDETSFHDPFLLYDMDLAIERIEEAIENAEKITIYGDYDADGITATTILYETLASIGANVSYYIPNRFEDGYGPNLKVYQELIADDTKLIVTVDNGVAGHEAIAYANENGVDVVVTDHHEIPESLPEAYAIVHPRHPKGHYPCPDLAGAGVALKVCQALLGEMPAEYIELAAIGTVADLVPLIGENRALVYYGLKFLKESQRPGLRSLYQVAGLDPQTITESSIGFIIAPRLNAVGRISDANQAVDLLLSLDLEEAMLKAEKIESLNQERKDLVEKTHQDAQAMAQEEEGKLLILASPDWHEGILGIVASRLVEEFSKPVILLHENQEKGILKGSGRSISSVNLYELIDSARDLTQAFGGHHMAAGLSLAQEDYPAFKQALEDEAGRMSEEVAFIDALEVDLVIDPDQATIEAIEELDQLQPFGTGNPAPVFLMEDQVLFEARQIGARKNHLKAKLEGEENSLDVIGFGLGDRLDLMGDRPQVSMVGQLEINEWNGQKKPQLKLDDLKAADLQVIDKRGKKIPAEIWDLSDSSLIFFDPDLYQMAQERGLAMENSYLLDSNQALLSLNEAEKVVFVDCPPSLELLKEILAVTNPSYIYACFYSRKNLYLEKSPGRKEFGLVYQYLSRHTVLPLENLEQILGQYLKIKPVDMTFIFDLFEEVGFIKRDQEKMQFYPSQEKVDLKETRTYQDYQDQVKAEEILLYSSVKELTEWLTSQKSGGKN